MSCAPPKSRADGVRIVFGPINIFSVRDRADFTSLSLTNSALWNSGSMDLFSATLGKVTAAVSIVFVGSISVIAAQEAEKAFATAACTTEAIPSPAACGGASLD